MPDQLTLSQLVRQACDMFAPADSSSRYYTAALHHAQAFRRELITNSARMLKTEYLDLGDDRSVALPDDYAEYRMLGITFPGWAGVRNLVYNDRLSLLPGENTPPYFGQAPADAPDFLTPPTSYECAQARYGLLDADSDGYCGFGGPWYAGEFRIDHDQHRIICSSRVPGNARLVLEYQSFAAADGQDIAVDPMAHSWGLNHILEGLNAQKKDWGAAAYYGDKAKTEKARYKAATSNFSLGNAQQANHVAAAGRWK